jgi:hypothetical protein
MGADYWGYTCHVAEGVKKGIEALEAALSAAKAALAVAEAQLATATASGVADAIAGATTAVGAATAAVTAAEWALGAALAAAGGTGIGQLIGWGVGKLGGWLSKKLSSSGAPKPRISQAQTSTLTQGMIAYVQRSLAPQTAETAPFATLLAASKGAEPLNSAYLFAEAGVQALATVLQAAASVDAGVVPSAVQITALGQDLNAFAAAQARFANVLRTPEGAKVDVSVAVADFDAFVAALRESGVNALPPEEGVALSMVATAAGVTVAPDAAADLVGWMLATVAQVRPLFANAPKGGLALSAYMAELGSLQGEATAALSALAAAHAVAAPAPAPLVRPTVLTVTHTDGTSAVFDHRVVIGDEALRGVPSALAVNTGRQVAAVAPMLATPHPVTGAPMLTTEQVRTVAHKVGTAALAAPAGGGYALG